MTLRVRVNLKPMGMHQTINDRITADKEKVELDWTHIKGRVSDLGG